MVSARETLAVWGEPSAHNRRLELAAQFVAWTTIADLLLEELPELDDVAPAVDPSSDMSWRDSVFAGLSDRWVLLYETEDYICFQESDPSVGGRVWFDTFFRTEQDANGARYDRRTDLYEFDCEGRRLRHLTARLLKGGRSVHSVDSPSVWSYVAPETIAELMWEETCSGG